VGELEDDPAADPDPPFAAVRRVRLHDDGPVEAAQQAGQAALDRVFEGDGATQDHPPRSTPRGGAAQTDRP
jgi:hypothetical protein